MIHAGRQPHRMVGWHHPAAKAGPDQHDASQSVQQLAAAMMVFRHGVAVRIFGRQRNKRTFHVFQPRPTFVMKAVKVAKLERRNFWAISHRVWPTRERNGPLHESSNPAIQLRDRPKIHQNDRKMTDLTANRPSRTEATTFLIILAVSFGHMVNDVMQSLLAAIYPLLKDNYSLSYMQIGLLTFTFQVTASLLQPVVGLYTDRRPLPFSLPWGMAASLIGLVVLAYAGHYWLLLAGAALIGIGSAVFHPEASRVARLASGGRFGLAQSLFQVGGNFGQSLGPLLAAFIVVPFGQDSIAWFTLLAATRHLRAVPCRALVRA